MAEARLAVRFAGPHVTVQDAGRRGVMRFGVPWSGPLDRRAFAAAQAVLGNPVPGDPIPGNKPLRDANRAAAIEISLGGLTLDCQAGPVTLAVAGGGFILDLGTHRSGSWSVVRLDRGDSLTIRPGRWGSWCYLAFAGQIEAPEWLGSRATHALSGLGGGRLQRGMMLHVLNTRDGPPEGSFPCPVSARPTGIARITVGPQDRFFSKTTLDALRTGPWRMTGAMDRMGMRLSGPAIAPEGRLDMLSEPVLRGSVQVAGDGVATVLLADHQTTGGYPKVATVLDCDLDALVQLRPRDPLEFACVLPEQAIAIARSMARADRIYMDGLASGRWPEGRQG